MVPDMYRTADLPLAAFLLAHGAEYLDSLADGKKVIFMFKSHPTIAILESSFYNDEVVRIQSYIKSLATLRSVIAATKEAL